MSSEVKYSGLVNLENMKAAVNYNRFLLKRIITELPQIKSYPAIDFGAGVGTFAELLREQQIRVECIEYDDNLRKHLQQILGYQVYKFPKEIPLASVNYIYSLNVLEHIQEDEMVLKELNQILAKQGVLYLYVPAFKILYSSMDRKVGHLRRYRYLDLKRKLEKAGFVVQKWQYVDSMGFFVSLLFRWIGNKSGDVNPAILKFYDRVLFPLSRIGDFFLKKLLGKNLEIVAEKK